MQISGNNLILQSQAFDVTWSKLGTVVANDALAPDNTLTADRVYPGSSGADKGCYQAQSHAAGAYTQSIYAKAAGINFIGFYDLDNATKVAWFNLSTGALGTVHGSVTATISDEGGGWYRCTGLCAQPTGGWGQWKTG